MPFCFLSIQSGSYAYASVWRDDHQFRILKWIFKLLWALQKVMCLGIGNEMLFFLLGCLELLYDFIWSYHKKIDAIVCNKIFFLILFSIAVNHKSPGLPQYEVVLNMVVFENFSIVSSQIWFARDKYVFGIVKWLPFIML